MWELAGQIAALCSIGSFITAIAATVKGIQHRRRKRLIEMAPLEDRTRLIEAALKRFAIDSHRLSVTQQFAIAQETLRQRSERFRWILVASCALFSLSMATTLAVNPQREPSLYQIRVTTLGLDGQPQRDSTLASSVDGIFKRVGDGWELEVPAAKRPANKRITLWARKESLTSQPRTVKLDRSPVINIVIQLELEEVEIRGLVLDGGGEAIHGAFVFIVGFEDEGVLTGVDGGFILNAHSAAGQRVGLRAQKEGYDTLNQSHPAGRGAATLVLARSARRQPC